MKLCFESVEEVRTFVKDELKGARRGGKDDGEANAGAGQANTGGAPTPLSPPAGQLSGLPGAGSTFTPPGSGFPGTAGPSPEIAALVNRLAARIDVVIQGNPAANVPPQPADQVLNWFRTQCGPEAANATMDQIKQVLLPKASQPTLENIARLVGA